VQHFQIPTMTCGHCVRTVTNAILAIDPAAAVDPDLAARTVSVTSTVPTATLSAAIADAGYANTPLA
jgi:copper chaperone